MRCNVIRKEALMPDWIHELFDEVLMILIVVCLMTAIFFIGESAERTHEPAPYIPQLQEE